jgi:hypothetical protein
LSDEPASRLAEPPLGKPAPLGVSTRFISFDAQTNIQAPMRATSGKETWSVCRDQAASRGWCTRAARPLAIGACPFGALSDCAGGGGSGTSPDGSTGGSTDAGMRDMTSLQLSKVMSPARNPVILGEYSAAPRLRRREQSHRARREMTARRTDTDTDY